MKAPADTGSLGDDGIEDESMDDESIDSSLDEIILEAKEAPLENPMRPSDGPKQPALALPTSPWDPEVPVEVPPPALPEPEVLSRDVPFPDVTSPSAAAFQAESNEITRQVLLSDVVASEVVPNAEVASSEGETKVESFAAAMRAAAKEQDEAADMGLATQAKEERDRALRQSTEPESHSPQPSSSESGIDVDLEDPRRDLVVDDTTETQTPSIMRKSEELNRESASLGQGSMAPPPGYPGRRLPTPRPGVLSGLPPELSPGLPNFGPGGTSPAIALTPSKTIPGFTPMRRGSAVFNTVKLPLGGLVAVLIATFGGGLLIGAVLWRVGPEHAMPVAVPAQATNEAAPVVAAPAPQPAAPAPVTPPAEATPTATPPSGLATETEKPAPSPAASPTPTSPAPSAAAPSKRAAAPSKVAETPPATRVTVTSPRAAHRPSTSSTPSRTPRPKKTASSSSASASKTDASSKPKTAWVDPFAQ